LHRLCALEGMVRSYDWGSRTVLAELLGAPSPSPEPQAEWWLGAHPRAPSRLRLGDRSIDLRTAIADDPEAILGKEVVARFGPRLPFLFKVLAVERPLSVQVHPDAEQAQDGHRRENLRGLALDAPERCYPDDRYKPELLLALDRFAVLQGFRAPAEIRAHLDRLGLAALAPAPDADSAALREWFAAWLAGVRAIPVRTLLERARPLAAADPACAWTVRLAEQHGDDPGVLAPLLLHLVELAPGDALFVPARELHCHLAGTAVEVMADSDNVVRAGLTTKHVDREELLRIACFESREPRRLAALPDGFEARFVTPPPEFELSVLALPAGARMRIEGPRSVELLVCLAGRARVAPLAPGSSDPLELTRGTAALAPAAAGDYEVAALAGPATLHRVRVPCRSERPGPRRPSGGTDGPRVS
jgi:mannose-6-phosphate isomerase